MGQAMKCKNCRGEYFTAGNGPDIEAGAPLVCETCGEPVGYLPAPAGSGMRRQLIYRQAETIQCPQCGLVQEAHAEHYKGDPWVTYVHECRCGYTITESDWDEVTE